MADKKKKTPTKGASGSAKAVPGKQIKPAKKAMPKTPKFIQGKPGSGGGVGTTKTPGWQHGKGTM